MAASGVRNSWQQFNLSIGKWTRLGATQGNCPDGFPSANKGHGQYGVMTKTPGDSASLWILVCLGLQVGNVNRLLIEYRTPGGHSTCQGQSASPINRGNVMPGCETIRSTSPSFCRIAVS
jgi:hypothetical protein